MEILSVTVSIPVSNLNDSIKWYRRLLNNPEEINPVEGIVEFNVDGTWLQLSKGKTGSKEWVFRIGVNDLMSERKRIHDLGIKIGEVKTVPGIITYFDLIDPDKNRLSFYQLLRTG